MVVCKNLVKKIGKRTIIKDISFTLNAGEVFGFLGPNGAGKTTTIKAMLGLTSITDGEIYIDGFHVEKEHNKALNVVGGIVENPEMYDYLTGLQNLKHYARMYSGISKARIDEVIKIVGLEHRIKDKVKKYSLGMKQRLGVAQAILHKPKLLVLDEPTNGLDPAGIKEFRELIIDLAHNHNMAVFVSSHILSEMEAMCDKVGIIQNGKLLQITTVDGMVAKQAQIEYSVLTDNSSFAVSVLNEHSPNSTKALSEKVISVSCLPEQIPSFIKTLVGKEINIYSVIPQKRSLEDAFLDLTGGSEID